MIKSAVTGIAKAILPIQIRRRISSFIGNKSDPIHYQGVRTPHNMRVLHEGRYSEIHDRNVKVIHDQTENSFRLRAYFLCMLAAQAQRAEGDFVEIGISYGVANHIIYDFINFPELGKVCHYVDPFVGDDGYGSLKSNYNTDIEKVKAQYPKDAPIRFHEGFIPAVLPLPGVEKISFAYLNTGAYEAEAKSIPWLYEKMSHGAIMVVDNYAVFSGHQEIYDAVLKEIGAEIFTMPTGQGVIFK